MNLPPQCRIKSGRVYLVRREHGKVVWTGLTRVDEGERAAWAAWQRHADRPTTIAELLAAYSAATDGLLRLAPQTQYDYAGAMRLRLVPEFGRSKPDDVTTQRVAMFLDKFNDTAANRAAAVLSSAYSWGLRKGYVTGNPCRGVRRNTERPRTRYVSHDDLRAALERATPAFRLLLVAAYLTGLRQGDLLKMQWDQVTAEGIRVQESKRGKQIVIRYSESLYDVIFEAMDRFGQGKPAGHVFVNNKGDPWTRSGVTSAMRRLQVDFTFHDLRAKAESDHPTGLGLLTRYKRARRVDALENLLGKPQ